MQKTEQEHVSANQITTFRDCPRKWYFDKIVKVPRTSTAATELGSAVHEELEHYLKTGRAPSNTPAGEIARSGLHLLPKQNEVYVELSIEEHLPIHDSPVKIVGFIDAIYPKERRILDHKTSGNKKYTKSERELKKNVQMLLYAKAYIDHAPNAAFVELTHVYYGTKSRWSKRVEARVTREHVEREWEGIKHTINDMIQTANAPTAQDAPPHFDACGKFGGCPYQVQCYQASEHKPKHNEDEKENTMKQADPKKSAITKILYVGCIPVKGASNPPVNAVEAYDELIQELNKSFNVPHLSCVEYGKGWAALVGGIERAGWPPVSALYLEPISKEYEHLITALTRLADVVVRRI